MNPQIKLERLIKKYQGYRINSIDELDKVSHEIREFKNYLGFMDFYRGQSLTKYELKSGLTRIKKTNVKNNLLERQLYYHFNLLTKLVRNFIRSPFKKDIKSYQLRNKWYKLFQAQHLGLKTRLMDWSINSTTAIYFAVENEKYHARDGTVHVFLVPSELCCNQEKLKQVTQNKDPFELNQDLMINTPIYLLDNKLDYVGERRISRQSGRFWIQSIEKSNVPLDEQIEYKPLIIKLIIGGNVKKQIKNEFVKSQSSVDWHYYRKDETIEDSIKLINKMHFQNNVFQKLVNYPRLIYFIIRKNLKGLKS